MVRKPAPAAPILLMAAQLVATLLVAALLFATPASAVTVDYGSDQKAGAGSTATFRLTVHNDEQNYFDIRMESTVAFPFQFSEQEFQLEPDETKIIFFQIDFPEKTAAGDYDCPIQVMKKQSYNPLADWALGAEVVPVVTVTAPAVDSDGTDAWLWLSLAVGVTGVAAAAYRWRGRWSSLLPGSTPARADPLDDESSTVRRNLVQAITTRPGMSVVELTQLMGLSRSTIYYHLQMLEPRGLVTSGPHGGWFPCNQEGPLLKPEQERVLKAVHHHKGLSQRQLAQRLEMSQTNLRHHLQKLRDLGALEPQR